MSYHRRYKSRDFDFAQRLVALRKRTDLTQEEVAVRISVTEKTIRNWEGGSHYPSDLNLQKLIELYLDKQVFTSGHEQDDARMLWGQLGECTSRHIGIFDEQWFAALLQEQQAHSISHAHQAEERQPHTQSNLLDQQPPVPLPVLETAPPPAPSPSLPSSRLLRGDWSAALDVSSWYGRTDELAELEQWLLRDQCRLVAVLGMGGIGKTTLAVKLVQQAASHFDCVLWRSLHNAPSLEDVLHDWLPILAEQRSTSLPQGVDQSLALLIGLLQERRCLLVLDNLETVFQEGVLEGGYRQGYEEYATLIRHVAQTAHQSCLVLTCRELFLDLGVFTGRHTPVRVFRLAGLTLPACQHLLQDKGLFGDQEAWQGLVQHYGGNPLVLKIVAETVHEFFDGDIAAFLAQGFTTFHGIRQLLTQQFERLSALEQALMYWLAIERELTSLETLRADLQHSIATSEVMEALHSLRSRSLVERGERAAVFTLQPVILEYMTERLVALVSDELRECKPGLVLTHALLQGQARDYLRASQARLILQPVLDKLLAHFGTTQDLEAYLERLLQQLRALPRSKQGYGGGNLVNLLIQLNGHLKGKDCSQLTIWQANLQGAEAQEANFAESDLRGSVFLETIEAITSVAVSADGYSIAAGGDNGEIRLWRVTDGQLLLAWVGHNRMVWSLAFHPEGSRLVSGGYDGLVKIWDVSTGQCVRTLQGHTRWVRSLTIHPTGRLLATCSDDGSIRFWDLLADNSTSIWHQQENGIWSLAFSPDGRLLASGDVQGEIKLWDLESQRCQWSITAHPRSGVLSQRAILSVAFSPNGKVLASGEQDAQIKVWETSSGTHLGTLVGHTARVHSVAFNAEGLLASGSEDGSVKLWQVGQRGEALHSLDTLHGHTGTLRSVVLGPNGLLVSGGQDGLIKIWQINMEHKGGRCIRTLHGHSRLMNTVAFSPDGRLLISSEQNGMMRMWETASGRCLRILSRHSGGSYALAFCPDGQIFANGSSGNIIQLWGVESEQRLRTLQGHQGYIWSLAFSPDGRFLVSGSLDTTIKRWEVASGQCLSTFKEHHNWVWSVAYSPDGKLLASGDVDGVVKVWEVGSGRCLHSLQSSSQAIVALMFTPDSQTLLSSNAQNLVTMWDVQHGQCLKAIPGIGDTYWLRSVALGADGNLVAAGSHDQTIRIWDVETGEIVHTLLCHAGQPWSVALSADQRLLACGTDEGSIMLWEAQTGEYLMTLRGDRPYERMNIGGVTGITEAQKASLKTLGAIEKDADMKH